MENAFVPTVPQGAVVPERQKPFTETVTFHITRLLLIFIMALTVSILFYRYVYTIVNPRTDFNPAIFHTVLKLPQMLLDCIKGLLIVSAGIWGLMIIKRPGKAVLAPLFCMAAVLILDAVISVYVFVAGLGFQYMPNILYYAMLPTVLAVPVIWAIAAISGYYKGRIRAAGPRQPISGLGGFMVLGIIRCFGIALGNIYSFIFMMLVYLRVIRPILPAQYFTLQLGLFYLLPSVLGIITLRNLFKMRYVFKPLAIFMELMNIIISSLGILFTLTVLSPFVSRAFYFPGLSLYDILMLASSVAFAAYYAASDRVANTFTNP